MAAPGTPLFAQEPVGLAGINLFYDREIVPALAGLERERREALKAGHRRLAAIVAVILAVGVAAASLGGYVSHPVSLAMYGLVIVAGFLSHTAFADFREVRHAYKDRVVSRLARFMGLHYWPEGHEELAESIGRLSLLPNHDFHECEDGFSGMESGLRFRLTEVALKRYGGSLNGGNRTVFRGILLTINLNKVFHGRTVAVRARSVTFPFLKSSSWPKHRVKLEDPRFELRFDVFSDDAVEARFLLAPLTMERIFALTEERWDLVAAFAEGNLHIAFGRKDSFEAGEAMDRMSKPKTARGIVNDLMAIRRLVAAVASAAEIRT